MMRTVALALALTAAIGTRTVSGQAGGATGSGPRTTTGVVKSFTDSSVTLDVRGTEVVFAVMPQTRLIAKGVTPRDLVLRERKAVVARWFAERVTARDRVRVTFRPAEGVLNAVEIRVVER